MNLSSMFICDSAHAFLAAMFMRCESEYNRMRLLYFILFCFSHSPVIITAASVCGHLTGDAGTLHEAMVTQQWVSQLSPEKRDTYLEAFKLRHKFKDEAIIHADKSDVVELLVFSGADVNQRDSNTGRTLIHAALDKGNNDIIKWLSKDGVVNLDIRDYENMTALDIAFLHRSVEIFDLLAKSGATVMGHMRDIDGNSPLHLAVSRNNIGFARTIVQYHLVDKKIRNNAGKTALHFAVKNIYRFDSNVFPLLLGTCSDKELMNMRDNQGNTVLHVAATQNYYSDNPVKTLVSCILLDLNIRNNDGNTALHIAAQYGSLDTIKILFSCIGRLDHELINNEELTAKDIANRGWDQSVKDLFNEVFPET